MNNIENNNQNNNEINNQNNNEMNNQNNNEMNNQNNNEMNIENKKNQLFKIIPTMDIINELLEIFGLKGLNDEHHFSREDLKKIDVVDKVNTIKEKLSYFYLPCKSRLYLNDLNEKNVITILKQFIKVYNYSIISREKYMKKKKFIIYKIIPIKDKTYNPIKTNLYVDFE